METYSLRTTLQPMIQQPLLQPLTLLAHVHRPPPDPQPRRRDLTALPGTRSEPPGEAHLNG